MIVIVISVMVILRCHSRLRQCGWPVLSMVRAAVAINEAR